MSSARLPPISQIGDLPTETQENVLDLLFEPHPAIYALLETEVNQSSFESYIDLIATLGDELVKLSESNHASDLELVDSILCAHPRLGSKTESSSSQAEQAQLNKGGESEARQLRELNREYETKFPTLRYVVFVNGRERTEIMKDMRRRIDRGDYEMERFEAIKAVCDIAADRLKKLS